jgi:hypothetical protein
MMYGANMLRWATPKQLAWSIPASAGLWMVAFISGSALLSVPMMILSHI